MKQRSDAPNHENRAVKNRLVFFTALFCITPAGAAALEIYRNAWRDYRAGINELIGGENA